MVGRCGVLREPHCKVSNALEWWLPGGAGLRMVERIIGECD